MNNRMGIVLPEPLAYFLTWPTYGTWLPGDDRGWVKRHHGHQLPAGSLELEAMARMTDDACRLDERQRRLVEQTVAHHCRIRGWKLHAVNCRSNHLHVVVTANRQPNEVCKQFKAWTVRKLKQLGHSPGTLSKTPIHIREKWWAERGSKRFLNDEDSLEAAILYVRDAQDAGRRAD
jgi:REP element-mobilizing transposase RayT